jgi:PAS domain S-box-containing protein
MARVGAKRSSTNGRPERERKGAAAAVNSPARRTAERAAKPAQGAVTATIAKPLDAADHQYRVLFEHSTLPMFVYDCETQVILAASDAYVTSFGYSRDELLKMKIADLLPADDRAPAAQFHKTRLSKPRPGRLESHQWHVQRKDGAIVDVEITSDDLDFDGRPCRTVFCTDVTERNLAAAELAQAREQLRASEQRYRLLFERSPQPIAAFDRRTLAYVAVNAAMVETYGYSREEFYAMTILDLALEEDREAMRAHFASNPDPAPGGATGMPPNYPRRRRRKDGTIIEIEITSQNVVLDGRDCRLVHHHDVTERSIAAAELAAATAELAAAHDRAVEASNMKSAFLANMSHELRTPMNGVIGMNELLLGSGLSDEQRSFAEQVTRSGEQMLAIINDILDIAKLETGHVELDLTDFVLRETIEAACAGPRIQATVKGLEFSLEIGRGVPRVVRGDSRRMEQVLANLASNAVKFTSKGAVSVAVTATRRGRNGTAVRLAVADTGIGIAPDQLAQVFQPFTQADASTTRLYGGTGLGLAIVRELVELMGGTVAADSEPGRGSTFWFELNLAAAARGEATRRDESRANGAVPPSWTNPPLVLVVEDSAVNQIVAARMLERCGCRVEVACDGREALAALERQSFDAVLMDCQMPGMDGYDATAEVRRRERAGCRTPIIAMTAHAMPSDQVRCLEAGMDDYISKPMHRDELVEALQRWIRDEASRKAVEQIAPATGGANRRRGVAGGSRPRATR